jgi:hypothetical protein
VGVGLGGAGATIGTEIEVGVDATGVPVGVLVGGTGAAVGVLVGGTGVGVAVSVAAPVGVGIPAETVAVLVGTASSTGGALCRTPHPVRNSMSKVRLAVSIFLFIY